MEEQMNATKSFVCEQSPPSKNERWPKISLALHATALGLTLMMSFGCAGISRSGSTPGNQSTVVLQASGDPGVTVHVASSNGVDRVLSVPASLEFTSKHFDLRCVHGAQPGRLSLAIVRDGIHVSTGDTTKADQVTVFKVQKSGVSAQVENVAR